MRNQLPITLTSLEANLVANSVAETNGLITLREAHDTSETLLKDFNRNGVMLEAKEGSPLNVDTYQDYLTENGQPDQDLKENFENFLKDRSNFTAAEVSELFQHYNQALPGFFIQLLNASLMPQDDGATLFFAADSLATTIKKEGENITLTVTVKLARLAFLYDTNNLTIEQDLNLKGTQISGNYTLTTEGCQLQDSITTNHPFISNVATTSLTPTDYFTECYKGYNELSSEEQQQLTFNLIALYNDPESEINSASVTTCVQHAILASLDPSASTFTKEFTTRYRELLPQVDAQSVIVNNRSTGDTQRDLHAFGFAVTQKKVDPEFILSFYHKAYPQLDITKKRKRNQELKTALSEGRIEAGLVNQCFIIACGHNPAPISRLQQFKSGYASLSLGYKILTALSITLGLGAIGLGLFFPPLAAIGLGLIKNGIALTGAALIGHTAHVYNKDIDYVNHTPTRQMEYTPIRPDNSTAVAPPLPTDPEIPEINSPVSSDTGSDIDTSEQLGRALETKKPLAAIKMSDCAGILFSPAKPETGHVKTTDIIDHVQSAGILVRS